MSFDRFFGSSDDFESGFMERIRKILKEIDKAAKEGNSTGEWEVNKIDRPDVKGYVIRGRFGTEAPNPFNPMQPQNPNERRPTPKRRFNLSQKDLEQTRELLTDVFEDEDKVTIYLEMPNENKEDIKLNIKGDKAEIKGKKCNRTVDLPTKQIDAEKASTKYKNGVFEISIPKKK